MLRSRVQLALALLLAFVQPFFQHGVCAEEPTVPISGDHPTGVDLSHAPPAPAEMVLTLEVAFAIRNKRELEKFEEELQDPSSPQYHHWLSKGEAHSRFGETEAEFGAVEAWLQSQGFTIIAETYGELGDHIKFQGTVAQVERVFAVTIVMPSNDNKIANLKDPRIPQRFASVISNVAGLDNLGALAPTSARPPRGASVRPPYGARPAISGGRIRLASLSAAPRSTIYDLIGGQLGFGPDDLSTFYGLAPLKTANINGTGTDCIAFISLTDFLDAAVDKFDTEFSIPAPSPYPIPRVIGGASNPGISGVLLEDDLLLGLEWAHAVAPSAPLRVYLGNPSDYSPPNASLALRDALQKAASDNACGAVSMTLASCGFFASFIAANLDSAFHQLATNGQTVFVASDDFGAAGPMLSGSTCIPGTTTGVNELSADPNVTSVGGTQFSPNYVNGVDQEFVVESVWDQQTGTLAGASGGGASQVFTTKPPWQTGLGVPADGVRDVPDIALMADPANMPGYFYAYDAGGGTAGFECCSFGGTSISAPIWAGIAKLVSQKTGARLGNINPQIYKLGTVGNLVGFRDVLFGTNSFNGVPGFAATTGYDQSTGWGTPDITSFVNSQNFVSVNVLICGGCTDNNCAMGNSIAACQKYNLATGKFTSTGSMANSRGFFPSVLLASGSTLLPGGWENVLGSVYPEGVVEIFNPSTGKVSSAAGMHYARAFHTGTRLFDGRVLVTGGLNSGTSTALKNGETYDPVANKWTLIGTDMVSTRYDHTGHAA